MAPSRTEKNKEARKEPESPQKAKSAETKVKKGTPKALAKAANEKSTETLQKDLDEFLGTPPTNKAGDSGLMWKVYKGPELKSTPQKDSVWSLFETNMRDIYIEANDSYLKWDPTKKKKELYHAKSRYILLETEDHSELAAFCMIRFEAEPNYEGALEFVLYVYEIQVAKAFQGSGICRRIFDALERLGTQYQVQFIMLTAFRCNPSATAAYRHLGYKDHIDTTENAFVLFKAIE